MFAWKRDSILDILTSQSEATFPSCRELFERGALDIFPLTVSDLLEGYCQTGLHIVSHRWETPEHPFPPNSEKLSVLAGVLEQHPDITHVWIDYACLPQWPRSPVEDSFFAASLSSIVFLFLTQRVIVMIDQMCKSPRSLNALPPFPSHK